MMYEIWNDIENNVNVKSWLSILYFITQIILALLTDMSILSDLNTRVELLDKMTFN